MSSYDSNLSSSNSNTIHLANLNLSTKTTTDFEATFDQFDASIATAPNGNLTMPFRGKFTLPSISWNRVEIVVWMVVPVLLHLSGIIFLAYAMFQQSSPYFEVVQTPGSGRLQYGILGSCAVIPDTNTRICGPRTLQADFVASIELVAGKIPGFASVTLPFYSLQTPIIFLSSLILISISFFIFILPWSLAYYPKVPYPRVLKKSIRDNSRTWYLLAGVLAFVSFVITLTIGIGYQLYLIAANSIFTEAIYYALAVGDIGLNGSTGWAGALGNGFRYVWIASAMQGATVVGINIALHNRINLIIERGGEEKQPQNYY